MKRLLTLFVALQTMFALQAATLKSGTEYYLWLNIYEKLLGTDENGTGPAISAFGSQTEADSYVFVAEESGTDGYVLLQQKSSGNYLAASSSNSYSVVFETTKSTDARFLWAVEEGTYSYLINKKSGGYLGVDGANKGSKYVSVYYDKPKGSHSQWTVIPTAGENWNNARAAYVSEEYTNAQGRKEIDYTLIKNITIDRSDDIDIHVTANTTPISGTTTSTSINLGSDRTWLIIDNITPSEVVSSYMKYIKINGKAARNNSNCRVDIYLNGAVVLPLPSAIMTCQGSTGEFTLTAANHKDLGKNNNAMTSFTLRRGYMATVASGTDGSGYSRVFVADHADLTVELPTALYKRVSSVYVKPWQYLSKKGWGNTSGASQGGTLRATWFWSWSAGYSSTTNMEFVPCRQHLYWPSASEVNNKTKSAALSINEPEHSEQHESSDCSCGGTISAWKAFTLTDDFKAGGGRIGSPQPTDLSYLTEFCKFADDNANRCDFTVTHAYWDISGRSESSYASWFVNQCKNVWNNTGRPLWITELEIGSSWGESWDGYSNKYETYRKYFQILLQKMDECPWIERYCPYGFDSNYWSWMFYNDGGITPSGQVYRDHRSTFAYNSKYTKVPTFWTPSVKTPKIATRINEADMTLAVTVTNANCDLTDQLSIQRYNKEKGQWENYYTETDRSLFDNEKIEYAFPLTDFNLEDEQLRVYVKRTVGDEITSIDASASYIENPNIYATSKDAVEGWTLSRSAANGYTKSTGDTYFEAWSETAAGMQFDYYQDVTDLPAGVYELSAVVFNTTNNVEGATVNGSVVLYAQADTIQYLTPVTIDSEIDYTRRLTVPGIVVLNGKMRIGIKNLGEMSARWAGGDEFKLVRTADLDDNAHQQYMEARTKAEAFAREHFFKDGNDASAYVVNPSCQRTDTYGWTVKNNSTSTGEASDGNAGNAYWNLWKGSAFTSTMAQDITYLPEGLYSVRALLRGNVDAKISLTASVLSPKSEKENSASTTITPIGNSGGNLKNGWVLAETPGVIVRPGDTLRILMEADITGGSGWWSADDFGLSWQYVEPLPDGIQSVDNDNCSNGKRTDGKWFDLTGRPILQPTKGIYLMNGNKIVIR